MRKVFSTSVLLLLIISLSCEVDKGLGPLKNGIKGTITFHGKWPESTDQILVVASTDFPPQGIAQLDMGESLPIGVDSTEYEIFLPPGLYRAVGIVWKEKDYEWNVNNIIGVYFAGQDSLAPAQVEVPENTIVDNINIVANLRRARAHYESSINGTLYFDGEWPEQAENLFVVASLAPLSPIKLPTLLDLYISSSLPIGLDSVDYRITVPPDTYRFLAVVVLERNASIGLGSIKGIRLGPIVVPDNAANLENIDITAYFILQSMFLTEAPGGPFLHSKSTPSGESMEQIRIKW